MSKRYLVAVVACILMLFSFSGRAYGQATGGFLGTVVDQSGSAVVGATITVTSQGTGATRVSTTDDNGHYNIGLLPVSIYTVRVEFKGFQTTETKDVKLQVDEQRELDFTLLPATVTSSVEVVANAVAVETANPSLGQVITSQQVAQLPLNGRDFVQLASLTPGTTQETSPASFFNGGPSSEVSARGSFSLSVGGSRANSTDWLLDGNDNNELTAGGIAIFSSIDSIQEFKVLTYNYSAEYGTRAGPTVLVSTKSGTNSFHGSLFEFFRNTSLDAKSFFATSTEKFNLNQFGGSVGGPIVKNKTFFFVDGEQKFQRHGIPFTGLVPSDAQRTGDFTDDAFGNPAFNTVTVNNQPVQVPLISNPNMSGASTNPAVYPNVYFQCGPGGVPLPVNAMGMQPQGTPCAKIPSALFNPIGLAMINLYPQSNANNPGEGFNYVNEPVRSLDETKFDIRLDQNLSVSDTLFGRFSYDQASSYVPGGAPGFAEQGAFASNQGIVNHGRNFAAAETHVFSPTDVNQISIGYNRIFNYITSQGTGTCASEKLGIPGANLGCGSSGTCVGSSCGLTSTDLYGGYWSLGDRGYSPFQGGTNVFSIADSFDMIRGKHDIHIGAGIRNNQMNVRAVGFQDGYWIVSGAWTGDAAADLLTGLASLRIHDQNFNGDITGRRWFMFRPFVQDDWRVTKDLTLNLGVAWSMVTPITESAGRMSNLVPSTGDLIIGGSGGVTMDWTAIEPRLGAAYKILGSDKTVLRAGYAIYHDAAWSQGAQGLWQNPPFAAETFGEQFGGCTFATAACALIYEQTPGAGFPGGVGLSDGFPLVPTPPSVADFEGNFTSQNTNFKQGRVQQYNANIERQIPGNIVLTLGYAGSRGSHILNYGNNLNVGSPSACGVASGYTLGCGPGGTAFAPPYLQPYSVILSINDLGRATYNSFQLKAETKSTRYGIYALIGYTYSRTYDTGYTDGLGTPIGAPYFPLPGWQNSDWGLSQINLNNNFTASVIYDLPFGRGKKFGNDWSPVANTFLGNWQVTVIQKITSGFPIFIVDSVNNSGVGFYNDGNTYNRPNQVCNPSSGFKQGLNEWFNVNCFASAPMGELGNAVRAPSTGPDFVNTDFSVIKRFALPWESTGLDFRAEFFNLWNHAQFGLPGTPGEANDINSPATFGKISSTVNNPRVIQFGLKLTF
jgi:Carboxypeptidase regulatory-like domain